MRKLLRYADAIVLFCATIGMMLQFWIFLGGTDGNGLYPARHPGWTLSWILSFAVLVFIWLLSRQVGNNRHYSTNFPPSIIGALGYLAGGLSLGYMGLQFLNNSPVWLDMFTGILGLSSGLSLIICGACRFFGKKPPFLCYMIPCFFFALQVFILGRELGGEPEPVRYLFRFLAILSLIPATYQHWGFSVGMGERSSCLFWNLLAGFLCILCTPCERDGILYMALGFWMLSNPCALKYLPRRSRPIPQPEPVMAEQIPAVTPEIPSTMSEDLFSTEPETCTPAPEAEPVVQEPEMDADAIIAEILRQIDSNIT